MARLLLIDDDQCAIETLGSLLRCARHHVVGAITGHEGLRLATDFGPDVAFVDLMLPDISGIEVVRQLRTATPFACCIVVTGYPSFEFARDALRVGATDWLDKPVGADDLLAAVRRALTGRDLTRRQVLQLAPHEPHAVTRLADVAVMFIGSREDHATLRLLGRSVGHAPGCLRNWCNTARVKARAFREFARGLRACHLLEQRAGVHDANVLSIVDERTLRRFRVKCGGTEQRLPSSVDDFMNRQQFVTDPEFVRAVRTALERTWLGDAAAGGSDHGDSNR